MALPGRWNLSQWVGLFAWYFSLSPPLGEQCRAVSHPTRAGSDAPFSHGPCAAPCHSMLALDGDSGGSPVSPEKSQGMRKHGSDSSCTSEPGAGHTPIQYLLGE